MDTVSLYSHSPVVKRQNFTNRTVKESCVVDIFSDITNGVFMHYVVDDAIFFSTGKKNT